MDGSGSAYVDGMGDYLHHLVRPDESVVASISLHDGDVVVTDTRILVQTRSSGLISTKATYAIGRSRSTSVGLARVTFQVRIIFGVILMISGVGGGLEMSGTEFGAAISVGVTALGALLLLTSSAVALLFDAGPDRVTIRVRSAEKARADQFFQQVAGLLRS